MHDAPSLMVACGLAMRRFDPHDPHQPTAAPRRAAQARAQQQFFVRRRRHRAVLGALIVVRRARLLLDQQLETQTERNRFLKSEIAKLDKEIEEIRS